MPPHCGSADGPVAAARLALKTDDVGEVRGFLAAALHEQLSQRLERVVEPAGAAGDSSPAAREHVEAVLGFEVFSHHTFQATTAGSGPHAGDVPLTS